MSDRDTIDLLAAVPLFEGRSEADLAELARVMRRRTVRAGDTLWRQGDHPRELEYLAVSLGGESSGPPAGDAGGVYDELEDARAPDSRNVRRMATFHDFDPLALWGFLTSGRYVRCPPGR